MSSGPKFSAGDRVRLLNVNLKLKWEVTVVEVLDETPTAYRLETKAFDSEGDVIFWDNGFVVDEENLEKL